MTKKEAWMWLLALTKTPQWMEDDELVVVVQYLAKIACNEKGNKKKGRRRKSCKAKTIVILDHGKLFMKGTAADLADKMGLSITTIRVYANKNRVDSKGIEYKYLEREKLK